MVAELTKIDVRVAISVAQAAIDGDSQARQLWDKVKREFLGVRKMTISEFEQVEALLDRLEDERIDPSGGPVVNLRNVATV